MEEELVRRVEKTRRAINPGRHVARIHAREDERQREQSRTAGGQREWNPAARETRRGGPQQHHAERRVPERGCAEEALDTEKRQSGVHGKEDARDRADGIGGVHGADAALAVSPAEEMVRDER